jgi:hypothetical protein
MADWLKDGGCEMVAIESTASYWKPLHNTLESSGLNSMGGKVCHMKAIPGHKTGVRDAEWIADLLRQISIASSRSSTCSLKDIISSLVIRIIFPKRYLHFSKLQ